MITRMKNAFFRANAGAVIIKEGKVLAFERSDRFGVWQMPQGGIDLNEDPYEAVLRETHEETAITENSLKQIAQYPEWVAYELPEPTEKHGMGQIQKWYFFEFVGDEASIIPQQPEFTQKQWMLFEDLISVTSSFKVETYKKLLKWAKEQNIL